MLPPPIHHLKCLLLLFPVNQYWQYKFRNVTADTPIQPAPPPHLTYSYSSSSHVDSDDDDTPLSPLQLKWSSYLSIASMVPNVTFLLLNAAVGHKFPIQPRLIASMAVLVAVLIFSDVMAALDTDAFQTAFLVSTLASVVVINIAVAILQGGKPRLYIYFFPL